LVSPWKSTPVCQSTSSSSLNGKFFGSSWPAPLRTFQLSALAIGTTWDIVTGPRFMGTPLMSIIRSYSSISPQAYSGLAAVLAEVSPMTPAA